ncbi:hypothetical protein MSAN_01347600 [Mycena sanguinolenta]|uniref:Uncharacterized protein n=1 Tax=Mycena sanguinolenta TaxID=230812 RepID=A0A8H6YAN9_9AGAR|nr:hypothetical protein MSAN_01347600 [Mycena sanguinolenta]
MTERLAFTMIPRLRRLTIAIYSDQPHLLIPWAQLTDLTLECDSLDLILDIMAQCTALTHASIMIAVGPDQVSAQRPPFALGHLHTLSLLFICPQPMAHFLGSVLTLALEELRLNTLGPHDRIQLEAPLAAYLARSPNITRLDIRCGSRWLTSHELIVILRHTSHLTHLELSFHNRHSLDDALLDALSYKAGAAPLVPHLHHLVLFNIREDATAALEHMLSSRWQADAEVASAPPAVARWSQVVLWGEYSKQFMDSMEMLQRKGLPLEIKS